MKQHLLLAMVIMNDPKLLLLDEPLNGLDPTSAINMRRILLELHNEGTTVIISSHNLDEIDRLTNTIYFMKDGALLKESLDTLAINQYTISVNDLAKAKAILDEQNTPYTVIDQTKLSFVETDIDLQTFINQLNSNDITIQAIENKKAGAEKRYQELFAGVQST
jgi:ABC-2 type transport system ATP-binding protein